MPVSINFMFGTKVFASPSNPLAISNVISWLAQAGYNLDLIRGEGLMLSEFLGRTSKVYGFLQHSEFLSDLKTFVYGPTTSTSSPSPSQRKTPESEGVYLAPPKADVKKHAAHRMERQLRLFSIIALLKCNNLFATASAEDVAIPTTLYQHGQGGIGDAAAHKIMATFTIKNLRLEDIVNDQASRTFLIYLQSETSILKSYFNNADSEIETLIRDTLLTIAKSIIIDHRLTSAITVSEFGHYVSELWRSLHKSYLDCCKLALITSSTRMFQETNNYDCRKRLSTVPLSKLMEAKRKAAEAALTTIVLDVYLDFATSTTECPLSEAEVNNLYETFHQP